MPVHRPGRRWVGYAACLWAVLSAVPHTAAWIACGLLSLRGVAGMVVDGVSDPYWWPTFLVGGIRFGNVAWLARRPRPAVGSGA